MSVTATTIETGAGIPVINHYSGDFSTELAGDVRCGLTAAEKHIPSKYFYDERGSRLFEQICCLPEYYVTRSELEILNRIAPGLAETLRNKDVVELGSGAHWKIKVIMEAATMSDRNTWRYIPVDVCEEAIQSAAGALCSQFPELSVLGLVADFSNGLEYLPRGRARCFFLFGSTLGNFTGMLAERFLRSVSENMSPDDRFLLGLDMVKPVDIIERAYNDSGGVTARFNKNVLRVINRELNADFDTSQFEHYAFYNHERDRVEMHLRSLKDQKVTISKCGIAVGFKKGETVRTEICRKFREETIIGMINDAGLKTEAWHTNSRGEFTILELVPV